MKENVPYKKLSHYLYNRDTCSGNLCKSIYRYGMLSCTSFCCPV